MKKKCKRLIALILVLSICFSMLSATAWAADVEAEEVAAEVVAEGTEEVVEEEAEEPVEEEAEEEPDQEQPQEEETTEEEAVVESDEAEETSISESITEDELETYADEALQIISALDSDSDDVIQVQVTGTYYQDDARSMLDMINEFRTGDDAWYWNSDNTTKTTCTGLSELEYDYGLERMAMIRAMEIAISGYPFESALIVRFMGL